MKKTDKEKNKDPEFLKFKQSKKLKEHIAKKKLENKKKTMKAQKESRRKNRKNKK